MRAYKIDSMEKLFSKKHPYLYQNNTDQEYDSYECDSDIKADYKKMIKDDLLDENDYSDYSDYSDNDGSPPKKKRKLTDTTKLPLLKRTDTSSRSFCTKFWKTYMDLMDDINNNDIPYCKICNVPLVADQSAPYTCRNCGPSCNYCWKHCKY